MKNKGESPPRILSGEVRNEVFPSGDDDEAATSTVSQIKKQPQTCISFPKRLPLLTVRNSHISEINMAESEDPLYKRLVRTFPDFPTPGITFIDWMPVLENAQARRQLTDALLDLVKNYTFTKVAGLESRGFLIGLPIAERLGIGFVPIRKKGKLPGPCIAEKYELEYGTAAIEIQKDAIQPGDKVLIADDLLTTGGTMAAANRLIGSITTDIVNLFFIELEGLNGSEKLEYPYFSLYTTHE